MGGQACILYGAAEFSRDVDVAVLSSKENLSKLTSALRDLAAEQVFLPPLEAAYLERGHACHFRCRHPEASGLRVDVMSVMRGCDSFPVLWSRREIADLPELPGVNLLSLPDLVQAKKTQRDKDWPMVRRLVEADYERKRVGAKEADIRFWLRQGRTPAILAALGEAYPALAHDEAARRPLLLCVLARDGTGVERALVGEQEYERSRDKAYWEPLRRELEVLRRTRGQG
ncbi:MAG: hypothetical protein HY721_09455 [Planctomycetes bacterium]|nr:hypothetical protein [Planctomycetota bacterium]